MILEAHAERARLVLSPAPFAGGGRSSRSMSDDEPRLAELTDLSRASSVAPLPPACDSAISNKKLPGDHPMVPTTTPPVVPSRCESGAGPVASGVETARIRTASGDFPMVIRRSVGSDPDPEHVDPE